MNSVRGRPKAFDESDVLQKAMDCFWKNGYEKTSLDILLKAMGIKKSSFYHFFDSKEKIFSRCLSLYRKNMSSYLNDIKKDIGPKATLLKLVEMTIDELRETGKIKGCLLVNSGGECYQKHQDLSSQLKVEFTFIFNLFEEFIDEAQSLGEIKIDKSSQVLSGRFMNSLNGLIVTIQAGISDDMIDDIVLSLNEILE